jgi:hypothetical protein
MKLRRYALSAKKTEDTTFNLSTSELATSLCLQSIELLPELDKNDPTELSKNLCAFLGETLKVAVSSGTQIPTALSRQLNIAISSNQLQPREKLILESMKNYKNPLNEVFKILSYQTDANTCAAVVHNLSWLLQLSGNYNGSYEIIGQYLARFEEENPKALDEIEKTTNYFFSYFRSTYIRRGGHSLKKIPRNYWPPRDSKFPASLSERISYFYTIYNSSNDLLINHLESGQLKYFDSLITEGLRRKIDPDFLKPILTKYFKDNNITHYSLAMLTHLPWGGDHLSLFKPLLIKEKEISENIEETLFLCDKIMLAAHVGDEELALKINEAAFNHAYKNDFEDENADYFYKACIAANLFDEAERWLTEGEPDEWDLPSALYDATDYLCSRGWELEEALLTTEAEKINYELIASKWSNGFDVTNDIKYFINSELSSGIDKIISLSFLKKIDQI